MPHNATKIASQATAASHAPANLSSSQNGVKGSWRGRALTHPAAKAGAAKSLMRTHEFEARALPTVRVRDLPTRRVVFEQAFRAMPTAQLFQHIAGMGLKLPAARARAQALARVMVRRARTRQQSGGAGALDDWDDNLTADEKFSALQLVEKFADEKSDKHSGTALLTPAEGEIETKEELAEFVRKGLADHANDEEALGDFLDGLLAGVDITGEEKEELAQQLRHARNDDSAIMEILRDAQQIPQIGGDDNKQLRQTLREKIHDTIRELEAAGNGEGQKVLASFNTALVAAAAIDPDAFRRVFIELVSKPMSFASALKLLLKNYPPESLGTVVPDFQKALAADMDAATPSHDLLWLGAVAAHIGNMILSRTFLEMVHDLIDHVPTANNSPINSGKLLVGLLDIVDGGSALGSQFTRLARDLGIAEGAPTIVFLTGVKKILRELPDKAFTEKNARIAMVDAVQDALDDAIEEEEAMNGNEEEEGS